MVPAILGVVLPVLGNILDKIIPDPVAREKAKAELLTAESQAELAAMHAQMEVILAEARGESWLQRNWRPILMLVIVTIVANNYLVAPYLTAVFGIKAALTLELPERLWDLMTLGVGGYVAGRSAEKIVTTWKSTK